MTPAGLTETLTGVGNMGMESVSREALGGARTPFPMQINLIRSESGAFPSFDSSICFDVRVRVCLCACACVFVCVRGNSNGNSNGMQ